MIIPSCTELFEECKLAWSTHYQCSRDKNSLLLFWSHFTKRKSVQNQFSYYSKSSNTIPFAVGWYVVARFAIPFTKVPNAADEFMPRTRCFRKILARFGDPGILSVRSKDQPVTHKRLPVCLLRWFGKQTYTVSDNGISFISWFTATN